MSTTTVTFPEPTADDLAYFEASRVTDTAIRRRILIERAILRRTATDLIAAGFTLRLHDGEDYATERTTDVATLMAAAMSTDEDFLRASKPSDVSPSGFAHAGMVQFIYGNTGWDVMADNSTSLDPHLTGANEYADALSEFC